MRVLVLNAGSGTVTATTLARTSDDAPLMVERRATLIHHRDPAEIRIDDADPMPLAESSRRGRHRALLDAVDVDAVSLVAHRVVHGGRFHQHAVVDSTVRAGIEDAARFAPLHNPLALELIDLVAERVPEVRHVACFDTAFHETIPAAAAITGGPKQWWDEGLRTRGFHGISHRDASRRAAIALGRPLADLSMITVHCGGGVSATAVSGGRSVDTTMGLTPSEGPIMAARSGSIDPGLLIHLLRDRAMSVDDLEHVLGRQSGLLGLSRGASGDERWLRRRTLDDPDAALAVAAYEHQLAAAVASLLPALERLDALVLTGDVLESDPELRANLCHRLWFTGVELDPAVNQAWRPTDSDSPTSLPDADTALVFIATDEETAMAEIAVGVAWGSEPP